MKQVSDTEVRSRVRSIIAHYRIDLQHVQMRITAGTVRFSGRFALLTGGRGAIPITLIEGLERDLSRAHGVKRLYFDLKNWRRIGPGEWVAIKQRAQPAQESTPLESVAAGGES